MIIIHHRGYFLRGDHGNANAEGAEKAEIADQRAAEVVAESNQRAPEILASTL